jgi:hypothetical protein
MGMALVHKNALVHPGGAQRLMRVEVIVDCDGGGGNGLCLACCLQALLELINSYNTGGGVEVEILEEEAEPSATDADKAADVAQLVEEDLGLEQQQQQQQQQQPAVDPNDLGSSTPADPAAGTISGSSLKQ